ncbi:uncharacterized protein LOC124943167 [Impatiens glandulifera]|uniref:uncharacterized protein LOC124943167 n=1 Tax=Impatiens glandulifera TaxID=253017 RepID=UPI001FB16026|nr:uncharacterized protein LOC124943167 [Impatiens glandulifera]
MISVNASASSISANVNSIPILNGNNFKYWKENILIILGCMDLDLALRIDRPTIIDEGIPKTFRGDISEVTDAKEFIEEIEKRFAKTDKAETSTLLASLTSMKYK